MRTRRAIAIGVVLLAMTLAAAGWWLRAGGRRASTPSGRAPQAAGALAVIRAAVGGSAAARSGRIAGTVGERGGGPLAGAQVCARSYAVDNVADVDAVDDLADERDVPRCALTDAAGAYLLSDVPAGVQQVQASAVGHLPARWRPAHDDEPEVMLAGGDVRAGVDFALTAGGAEVAGVVADVAGGSIAGALVIVSSGPWPAQTDVVARTDAAGRFVTWVAPGPVDVYGEADGYVDGQVAAVAPAQAVELLLVPASSLAGVVVMSGTRTPVADAVVTAGDLDPEAGADAPTARTDAAGRFVLAGLAPGRYKPLATVHGRSGEPGESVLLGLGQRVDDVVIELHPAATVRGRIEVVTAGVRAPCGGGQVRLRDRLGRVVVASADRGAIELPAVRPGRYEVEVTCWGELVRDRYDPIVVADADVDGLVWTVGGGGSIRGVVRTAAGAPIAGVSVMAERVGQVGWSPMAWLNVESGADGEFVIGGLAAGRHRLTTWSDAHVAKVDGPTVMVIAGEEVHADLVLAAVGAVAGIVVDADGAPVAGRDVRATGARFELTRTAITDEAGRFALAGIEPGDCQVIAGGWHDPLRRPGTTDDDQQGERVTVVAGETTTVRLVVERRAGVITGTVRDERGQPVVDAWVIAERESDSAQAEAGAAVRAMRQRWRQGDRPIVTDVDGGFALRGLSPGSYAVRAYRRGGGEAIAEHVAVGAVVGLVIRPAGAIGGQVVAAGGGPLDDVAVTVTAPALGVTRAESFYRTGGRFTIRDLPAGSFTVTAAAAGGRASVTIALAAGQQRTDVALTLQPDHRVRGRVVDLETERPVVGMTMSIAPRGADPDVDADPGGLLAGSPTDGDGRFEIAEASHGPAYLIGVDPADDDGHAMIRHPIAIVGGATVELGDIPAVRARVHGEEPRGQFGLMIDPPAADAEPATARLQVTGVMAGSAAAQAGIRAGDVIVTIDGHDVRGPRVMIGWSLMAVPPGTTVGFGLARGDTVRVTAGVRR